MELASDYASPTWEEAKDEIYCDLINYFWNSLC